MESISVYLWLVHWLAPHLKKKKLKFLCFSARCKKQTDILISHSEDPLESSSCHFIQKCILWLFLSHPETSDPTGLIFYWEEQALIGKGAGAGPALISSRSWIHSTVANTNVQASKRKFILSSFKFPSFIRGFLIMWIDFKQPDLLVVQRSQLQKDEWQIICCTDLFLYDIIAFTFGNVCLPLLSYLHFFILRDEKRETEMGNEWKSWFSMQAPQHHNGEKLNWNVILYSWWSCNKLVCRVAEHDGCLVCGRVTGGNSEAVFYLWSNSFTLTDETKG